MTQVGVTIMWKPNYKVLYCNLVKKQHFHSAYVSVGYNLVKTKLARVVGRSEVEGLNQSQKHGNEQ